MLAYAPRANRHHLGRMEWGEAMSGIWGSHFRNLRIWGWKTLPRCHPNPGIDKIKHPTLNLRNLTTKYANILMYFCFAPFDVFESDIKKKIKVLKPYLSACSSLHLASKMPPNKLANGVPEKQTGT